MRGEIQTYTISSPCGVLSVFGVFLYKEFFNFLQDEQIVSLGAPFLVLNEYSQNYKNKRLVLAATSFPAEFSRSKHDSATAMFTGWSPIFEMLTSRVKSDLNSSTSP